MIINSIKFYKTPLDIGHSRIIDVVGARNPSEIHETYNEALSNYEQYDVVQNIQSKSVRIINKRAELVVQEEYFDIRDYNYCVINDNTYFFIESISQLNDVTFRPTCSVTLLWDYWANNIVELLREPQSPNSVISTRHIDRFDSNEMLFYRNDSEDVAHTEKILPLIKNYRILFIKLTVKNSMFYDNYDNPNEDINLHGVPKFYFGTYDKNGDYIDLTGYTLPYFDTDNVIDMYIPIAVINTNTNEFVSVNIKYTTYYIDENGDEQYDYINVGELYRPIFSIDTILSEHILNATLTYNSPFEYEYVSRDNSIYFYNATVYLLRKDKEIEGFTNLMSTNGLLVKSLGFKNHPRVDEQISLDYIFNIKTFTDVDDIDNDINNNDNGFDPKLFIYPFRYIKLKVGGEDIIISPNRKKFKNVELTIFNKDSDNPSYIIEVDGNSYSSIIRNYINNYPSLAFSTLSIDDYNLRNGTQNKINDNINILKSYIGSVTSVFTSKPKGMLSSGLEGSVDFATTFLETTMKRNAILKDISNMPDIYHSPPLAEYDLINCDRFIFTVCEMCDCNYYTVKKEDFRVYGYELDIIGDPLDNFRVWFDFVQTSNCKITHTINEEDRIEIQNMFNRGVHKFHIHANNTTIFNKSLSLSPIGHNNIEISIWEENN